MSLLFETRLMWSILQTQQSPAFKPTFGKFRCALRDRTLEKNQPILLADVLNATVVKHKLELDVTKHHGTRSSGRLCSEKQHIHLLHSGLTCTVR